MFKLIAVTDRASCREDFLTRIEKIAHSRYFTLLLREKELDTAAYETLANQVEEICQSAGSPYILRNTEVALKKGLPLHLSFAEFLSLSNLASMLPSVGVSIHSVAEAVQAQKLGAHYLIAGHIFETDCKKGLTPRGLSFLSEVCNQVRIPVYAIGGISSSNIRLISDAGAAGACIMSSVMSCPHPERLGKQLLDAVKKS